MNTAGQAKTSPKLAFALMLLFALICLAFSPWLGAEPIRLPQALADLLGGVDSREARILALRLPRIVLGFVAGGALALAGATFQTLLRNALATPYTLGVSFAGALGAFLAISIPMLSFSIGPLSSISLLAFAFAALDVMALYALSRRSKGLDTHELLLAGVTLNFFCGAAILSLRFFTDPLRLTAMDHWMMGGLSIGGWGELVAVPAILVPGVVLLLAQAPALDQLSFGEELAAARGVDVSRVQKTCLFAASAVTAAVVAVTGPIGFVGLIAPHTARHWMGPGHRWLMPGVFLLGGGFLVLADTAARSLGLTGRGAELPVGILTALAGAPFFLLLLLRGRDHQAR